MELTYRSRDGSMIFKLAGVSQKDLFREVAQVQDVFEADTSCGLCSCEVLRFAVRTVDANTFYSLKCMACSAELQFGQHKNGQTLYAKRSGETRGWSIWQPEKTA